MKLTLGRKLGLGFGTILALMVVGSAVSYFKLADIRTMEEKILKVRVPTIEACKQLQTHLQYSNSKARQGILAGEEAPRRAAAVETFGTAWDSIEKDTAALQELSSHWTLQENRDRLTKVKDGLAPVREGQQAMMNAAASGAQGAVIKAGNEYADKITPLVDDLGKVVGDLSNSFDTLLKESETTLTAANSSMTWALSVTTLLALGIGASLAVFLSRQISAATGSVLAQAEAIAGGDLTHEEVKRKR